MAGKPSRLDTRRLSRPEPSMARVPDHFFTQSAVLPYRLRRDRLEILMVTSRRRRRWVIPKGVQEPGLSAIECACREAFEEAGVEGSVESKPLGTYRYEKWGGTCSVVVFLMAVTVCHASWPESFRDREWVTPEEAARRAAEPELQAIIRALPAHLDR